MMRFIARRALSRYGVLLTYGVLFFTLSGRAEAATPSATLGFPVGEKSRLHTNLDLAFGFDTNPYRSQSVSSGQNPVADGDYRAMVRPGVVVLVPGTSINLDLGANMTINQQFGAGSFGRASDASTRVGTDINANAEIGSRDSPVAFRLYETLLRTPSLIPEAGTITSDEFLLTNWYNETDARLVFRPGGGALEFDLGYQNRLLLFDSQLSSTQLHGAVFETRWKFLPKTAFVAHFDGRFFDPDDSNLKSGLTTLNATPIHAYLGLIGLVTPRVGVEMNVGYGDALSWAGNFFGDESANNQRTLIGKAAVSYAITEQSKIVAGYERTVDPVAVLDNYISNAVNARVDLTLTPRLLFTVFGRYDMRHFGELDAGADILTADARMEYWFFDYMNMALSYRILNQNGKQLPGAASSLVLLQDYTRHQFFTTLGFRY